MSGNNVAKHCCCGGANPCPYDPTCTCNPQYTLVGWQGNVSYQHLVGANFPTQACCFDVVNWSFNANIVPLTQVLVQRYPNPAAAPCCYRGYFDVRITGSLRVWWDFDIQSGPPLFPKCQFDTTYNFTEDVPAYLDIWCNGGTWYHQITICHFQITCNSEENTADCEGGEPPTYGCTSIPLGLRCAGGTFLVSSPLVCLQDINNQYTNLGYCSGSQFFCNPPPDTDPLWDYNDALQGNGSGAFFGIYRTEECDSGQDPFPPCQAGLGAQAGSVLYASAPLPDIGYWCSGNIDPPYEDPCADWERIVIVNWGQYV